MKSLRNRLSQLTSNLKPTETVIGWREADWSDDEFHKQDAQIRENHPKAEIIWIGWQK